MTTIPIPPDRLAALRTERDATVAASQAQRQQQAAALAEARQAGRDYATQRATWSDLERAAVAADRYSRGWPLSDSWRPPLPAEAQVLDYAAQWAFIQGMGDIFHTINGA